MSLSSAGRHSLRYSMTVTSEAEAAEHRGELHADDPSTDDGQATGEAFELEQSRGINDTGIGPGALDGEPFCLGAGGNDNVRGDGGHEGGAATDEGDIGMGKDGLDPLTELGDDLRHATAGLVEGGGVDIGLGGDAAHIEACAAHLASLEDRDLQTLSGGIFSGAVATRPRTDDNQICCI